MLRSVGNGGNPPDKPCPPTCLLHRRIAAPRTLLSKVATHAGVSMRPRPHPRRGAGSYSHGFTRYSLSMALAIATTARHILRQNSRWHFSRSASAFSIRWSMSGVRSSTAPPIVERGCGSRAPLQDFLLPLPLYAQLFHLSSGLYFYAYEQAYLSLTTSPRSVIPMPLSVPHSRDRQQVLVPPSPSCVGRCRY